MDCSSPNSFSNFTKQSSHYESVQAVFETLSSHSTSLALDIQNKQVTPHPFYTPLTFYTSLTGLSHESRSISHGYSSHSVPRTPHPQISTSRPQPPPTPSTSPRLPPPPTQPNTVHQPNALHARTRHQHQATSVNPATMFESKHDSTKRPFAFLVHAHA